MVGAVYDAFWPLPGADDNDSGVAGLIELAYLLGQTPPALRTELVAFTPEEPKARDGDGLFRSTIGGSAVHASSLLKQNAKVRIVLNLEMIGFFRDDRGSQQYPLGFITGLLYPRTGDFVTIIGRFGEGGAVRQAKSAMRAAATLPVQSMSAPVFVTGIDWSDHSNYWKAGYPAIVITDASFYRNPNYHQAGDRPGTLDCRMAMVVQAVDAAVRNAPSLLRCYDEWRKLLSKPVWEVCAVVVAENDEGQRLRQNCPFAAALPPDEVLEIKRHFRHELQVGRGSPFLPPQQLSSWSKIELHYVDRPGASTTLMRPPCPLRRTTGRQRVLVPQRWTIASFGKARAVIDRAHSRSDALRKTFSD